MGRERAVRFPVLPALATALALVLLALGAVMWSARRDAASQPGETWRRGLLGGDQLRLLDDGRYVLQRWGCFGPGEILESGAYSRFGDVISLSPATAGQPPRTWRFLVRDGERVLEARGDDGSAAEREVFERL